MIHRAILITFLFVQSLVGFSQTEPAYKKGTFYAFWGWNRGAYTNSDIHFKGNDYNFTLRDVKAADRQTKFSFKDYFRIDRITIPQTNLRVGYFIKDNLAITLGVDHMKYVMDQDQTVDIDGYVKPGYESHVNADNSIKLADDFLQFEHTDGLNYINSEIEYYKNFYTNGILKVNGLIGGGAGILLPRSNVTMMGNERHDAFHLAGFGLSAKGGLDVNLWNLFFLRSEIKEGYINMPSIRTTKSPDDKAHQAFWFAEWTYTFGFNWHF
ncbi:hypothetical protein M2451_002094 [Dysgonomonas sp. PFB1-18]|uniref:hypothetical protein n=1 Tax=unclassified Dysgonomonas TaxID=2630389 RepID=UPI002472E917|nr:MULTISPECIES: hypothetical protein [unclassified Dysgonomonas]MDH6309722.1 hypothetical protein [Dysgonomonas sp. PF1-14]MDH6339270.1 hypothetical protein [Dysgonomonas sp. PF1-16]MDH6380769.1 hypothetical protein [Dysgonomonas sp. PFB1-18]MDH6398265.1 hypothetical protein [Dysgonomonas sp. PF1-23]